MLLLAILLLLRLLAILLRGGRHHSWHLLAVAIIPHVHLVVRIVSKHSRGTAMVHHLRLIVCRYVPWRHVWLTRRHCIPLHHLLLDHVRLRLHMLLRLRRLLLLLERGWRELLSIRVRAPLLSFRVQGFGFRSSLLGRRSRLSLEILLLLLLLLLLLRLLLLVATSGGGLVLGRLRLFVTELFRKLFKTINITLAVADALLLRSHGLLTSIVLGVRFLIVSALGGTGATTARTSTGFARCFLGGPSSSLARLTLGIVLTLRLLVGGGRSRCRRRGLVRLGCSRSIFGSLFITFSRISRS
mmetsp:Transcript_20769/g.40764  ORF Transcript_20769/g.40764 Transcript_20769/m.40764 type:complete len:299 (-) Transcript_20769:1903-2799(-)